MRSSSAVRRTRHEACLRLHQSRGDSPGSAQHGDRFDRRNGPVGTTFRIKIPLTLAIIPALVVTAGGAMVVNGACALIDHARLFKAHQPVMVPK